MSRVTRWVLASLVGIFVIVALGVAALQPAATTADQTAREVSESLRCPTCAGESIADSSAMLSEAMRETVRDQLAQGQTPDEIRSWFAQRYGDEVLLEPPQRGYGWLLWALPLVLVAFTVVVFLHPRRTPRRWLGPVLATLAVASTVAVWTITSTQAQNSSPVGHDDDRGHESSGEVIDVLRQAVNEAPGDTQRRLALATALERSGDTAETAEVYASVVRLQPLDPDLRYRYAFALVRNEEVGAAVEILDETLSFEHEHPPSMLLLGALLQEIQPDRGEELLERFVNLDPDHPAAEEITELREDGYFPVTELP